MHLTIIKCKEKQGHLRLQKGATKLTNQTDSSNRTDSYLTKIIFNKLWILTLNIRKNGLLWSWGAGNFTGIALLFSRSFQERLIVESNSSNATCDRVGYSERMQAMEASFMLEWDEGIIFPSNATCDHVGYSESMQAMEASFMLEWDVGIIFPLSRVFSSCGYNRQFCRCFTKTGSGSAFSLGGILCVMVYKVYYFYIQFSLFLVAVLCGSFYQ